MARFGRLARALPFLSLAISISSALLMSRTPERAWIVASAAVASFVTLALLLWWTARGIGKLARFVLMSGTQSMVQLNLLFSIPLYFEAARSFVGQWSFLGTLGAAALLTFWDPLYTWWVGAPFRAALLQTIAIFAGLNCVLPMLGLSNRLSLAAASSVAIAIAPLTEWLMPSKTIRRRFARLLGCAVLPITLFFGAARLIPPAPLRFVGGAIGTAVSDRSVVGAGAVLSGRPEQLVCFTSVAAPRGLRDALVHVWSKNGQRMDAIELQISGGRSEGYRTWSTKRNLGAQPEGLWSCRTETSSGQWLGETVVTIE